MARARFGLTLYPLDERYNRASDLDLTFTAVDLSQSWEPVEDTLGVVNDATVSRRGGSSYHYQQPAGRPYAPTGPGGVGVFATAPTLNVQTDGQLPGYAGHYVKVGTVDEDRHPRIAIDLRRRPSFATAWNQGRIGMRIRVTGNYSTGATEATDQIVEGWTEEISPPFVWRWVANAAPFSPYRAATIQGGDTGTWWRIDTAASSLAQDYPVGSTTLSVNVTDGYLWSTAAGDYPRDIEVYGARVTVSAVAGVSSPQTFTVASTPIALPGSATVRLWRPNRFRL